MCIDVTHVCRYLCTHVLLSGNAAIRSKTRIVLVSPANACRRRRRIRRDSFIGIWAACEVDTHTEGEMGRQRERREENTAASLPISPCRLLPSHASPIFFCPILHPFIRVSFLHLPAFKDDPPHRPPPTPRGTVGHRQTHRGGFTQRSKLI